MDEQWQQMMQSLIESNIRATDANTKAINANIKAIDANIKATDVNTKTIASNAKAIEALGNQAAEDRALIRQVGEGAQQVAAAVARLVDIIQGDRERLARQEIISQSLLERLNRLDP